MADYSGAYGNASRDSAVLLRRIENLEKLVLRLEAQVNKDTKKQYRLTVTRTAIYNTSAYSEEEAIKWYHDIGVAVVPYLNPPVSVKAELVNDKDLL